MRGVRTRVQTLSLPPLLYVSSLVAALRPAVWENAHRDGLQSWEGRTKGLELL